MPNTHAVSDDTTAMAAAVARYNMQLYSKRLAEETDETKRQTILQLIAEEKAKLHRLSASLSFINV